MMANKYIPETIENRWDILYRDYPEIYHQWAKIPKRPTAIEVIQQHFPLAGLTVADIGSGSGLSTFELARFARKIIGVEPELAMRNIADLEAHSQCITNVEFIQGWAEKIPLPNRSVDAVTAITLASLYNEENITAFTREAKRVVRPGGFVLSVDISSGWYGGELSEVILGQSRSAMEEVPSDLYFPRLGYHCIEFFTSQEYGSVENTVQTYGFIFGKNAIKFIKTHNIHQIQWKFHIHYYRIS